MSIAFTLIKEASVFNRFLGVFKFLQWLKQQNFVVSFLECRFLLNSFLVCVGGGQGGCRQAGVCMCSPRFRWFLPLLVKSTLLLLLWIKWNSFSYHSESSAQALMLASCACVLLHFPLCFEPMLLAIIAEYGTGLDGVGGVSEENQLCDLYWAQGAWLPLAKPHTEVWPLHLALKSQNKNKFH